MAKIKRLLIGFITDESGQGITEYGSVLAWACASFVVILGIFWFVQHGYIGMLTDSMCKDLRSMASNSQTY